MKVLNIQHTNRILNIYFKKVIFILSIIFISNTVHSAPKSDKKNRINSLTSTETPSEESEKVKKLQEELDAIRKEFSSFKEDTEKKLDDLSNKTQERIVVKEPNNATKSLSPIKASTPTGESMTTLSKPAKTYGIQSKGLKLKDLDENNGGKRHAIVVGINNYQDTGISDLSKARNDAKLVGKILREQGEFEQVFVMTDDVDPRNDKENLYPTKLNIEEKLDSLLRFSEPEDLVVFFFSGHGISDPDENGYLVTVDTVTDKQFNTSLRVNDVVQRLKNKGIKKSLLVLDACRDVLYSSKSSSRNSLLEKEYTEAEVAATFYSTKAGYYSYEDDETDYGVFTKYLVMGMEGSADSNGDGVVAFSELEQYVQKGVNYLSTKKNKQQNPITR
jgi:Skp family chaperone for outer membrane proteins